ncbi:hypothetical protein [Corynebacterium sp.]|uniref:hypothetical protein n=1 Tax=Corynebacterium sp. TaxID=1720 RepID=UPI0026DFB52D|nr:hypothetical protein [Corynebacterium sp.]MDO5511246.1 hypothetical protein [Corynebacterium sp.]
METPEMFIRAADWAQERDFGCPVGLALRRILLELTGPPRVGACTLDGPVPLPGWPVREVCVRWPVLTPGADIVVLIHPGPLTAALRSRIAAGPQVILVVPELPARCPELPLIDARSRLLAGELRALASRHPAVAGELLAIAGPDLPARGVPRVAVIGPGSPVVELPGCEVVNDPHVDVVLAVAPPGGWNAADHPTLRDAARRCGRLVSTAPLPADVPGQVLRSGQSELDAVWSALRRPVAVPEPRPGTWLRAADHLERRRPVTPGSPPVFWEVTAQAVALGAVAGLAAAQTAPAVGVAAAVTVGGMRWWTGRREARRAWLREETARLRTRPSAPAAWLRRQVSEEL